MTVMGNNVKDKRYEHVDFCISPSLENGEKIIALCNANRIKPQATGIVLTTRRMLVIKGTGLDIRIVNEVAADDIAKFDVEKGMGKIRNLMLDKKLVKSFIYA